MPETTLARPEKGRFLFSIPPAPILDAGERGRGFGGSRIHRFRLEDGLRHDDQPAPLVQPPEETGAIPLVTGPPHLADSHEEDVRVTVDPDRLDVLDVSRGPPFVPR